MTLRMSSCNPTLKLRATRGVLEWGTPLIARAAGAQMEFRWDVMYITACGHRGSAYLVTVLRSLPVNRICARMFGFTLFVFLVLAIAANPAGAQQEQARHIVHRLIPAGDTCAPCHKAIYDQWKASPHSANGVECTVCHGETTAKDFAGTPALGTCEACHTDQVAQLKSDPFMSGKTCVSCHQAHAFVEHKKTPPAGN